MSIRSLFSRKQEHSLPKAEQAKIEKIKAQEYWKERRKLEISHAKEKAREKAQSDFMSLHKMPPLERFKRNVGHIRQAMNRAYAFGEKINSRMTIAQGMKSNAIFRLKANSGANGGLLAEAIKKDLNLSREKE